jgi:hypothetical protein
MSEPKRASYRAPEARVAAQPAGRGDGPARAARGPSGALVVYSEAVTEVCLSINDSVPEEWCRNSDSRRAQPRRAARRWGCRLPGRSFHAIRIVGRPPLRRWSPEMRYCPPLMAWMARAFGIAMGRIGCCRTDP